MLERDRLKTRQRDRHIIEIDRYTHIQRDWERERDTQIKRPGERQIKGERDTQTNAQGDKYIDGGLYRQIKKDRQKVREREREKERER